MLLKNGSAPWSWLINLCSYWFNFGWKKS